MLYKSQEGVSKLINDYYSIASEANNKTIHGKEILGMYARPACAKFFDHSNFKMLSPKQMHYITNSACTSKTR